MAQKKKEMIQVQMKSRNISNQAVLRVQSNPEKFSFLKCLGKMEKKSLVAVKVQEVEVSSTLEVEKTFKEADPEMTMAGI